MSAWVLSALILILHPVVMLESFSTVTKLLNVNPKKLNAKGIMLWRLIGVVFLTFGSFVLACMLCGEVAF